MEINSYASATDVMQLYVFVPKLHAGTFLTFSIRKQFSSTFPG